MEIDSWSPKSIEKIIDIHQMFSPLVFFLLADQVWTGKIIINLGLWMKLVARIKNVVCAYKI